MRIGTMLRRIRSAIDLGIVIDHKDPFKVLVATVISQRTKDANTAKASKVLFAKYGTPRKMAKAPLRGIERLIHNSGFYKQKAKHIKELSRRLVDDYGGRVPHGIDEMVKLPGVGRKTANCVLVYAFGEAAIPVDVHVHRISNRLGLVKTKTPEQTERELTSTIDRKYWLDINALFVKFGQQICLPRNPHCCGCPLNKTCPSNECRKK